MNYISQTNIFFTIAGSLELSSQARILYLALLNKNNQLAWAKSFTCTSSELESLSGLSESGLRRARQQLSDKGLIEHKKRGANRAPRYSIYELTNEIVAAILNGTATDTTADTPTVTPTDSATDTAGGTTGTLNKTKQNKLNYKDIRSSDDEQAQKKKEQRAEKRAQTKQLENDFEKLWDLMPKKVGKQKAFKKYLVAIKGHVTNKQIQDEIVAYKELRSGEDPQFTKQGDTFFNQKPWEDKEYSKLVKQAYKGSGVAEQQSRESKELQAVRRRILEQQGVV